MEDKQLSFYSNLALNYYYFWKECKPEGYMKTHVAAEIVYSIYRLILQENRQGRLGGTWQLPAQPAS
jgi:hypothetical protein